MSDDLVKRLRELEAKLWAANEDCAIQTERAEAAEAEVARLREAINREVEWAIEQSDKHRDTAIELYKQPGEFAESDLAEAYGQVANRFSQALAHQEKDNG